MSDQIKIKFAIETMDMSGATTLSLLTNGGKVLGFARKAAEGTCDQCGDEFGDDEFRMYDHLCLKEDTNTEDEADGDVRPRVMCRSCYDCRNDLPARPAKEGHAWLVRMSPLMTCPDCHKLFANRYAKRHRGGLPVNGEAGKIACHSCERAKAFTRSDEGRCHRCGTLFPKKRNDAKYCSAKCRVAASRAKPDPA